MVTFEILAGDNNDAVASWACSAAAATSDLDDLDYFGPQNRTGSPVIGPIIGPINRPMDDPTAGMTNSSLMAKWEF